MSDLPPSWAWARLDEIAEVRLGRQRSPKNHTGANMRPYLRAANVDWTGLKLDDVKQMNFTHDEARTYRLQLGDIVLGEASGSPSEVGKPALWNGEIEDCCFQNTLLRVRSYGPEPRYLLHFLWAEAASGAFAEQARGVGIHHLGASGLASWRIPVPPLVEQRRIVTHLEDHLSRLTAGVSTLDAAQMRLSRFRETVFAAAIDGRLSERAGGSVDANHRFWQVLAQRQALVAPGQRGRPEASPPYGNHDFAFPEEWALLSMEQVTHPERTISYGILKPGPNLPDGVPYVRVVNMRGGRISVRDLHRTSLEIDAQYSRARLHPGDVLISIRGTYGRVTTVPAELEGANITQDAARLAFLDGIDPDFACIYLRSPQVQRHLRRVARGVAVKGVNIGDLRKMPFPVPAMSEQREIINRVSELISEQEAATAAVGQGAAYAKTLRASLLAEAFAGRLTQQDPSDEPASELLARIRVQRKAAPTKRTRSARTSKTPPPPPITATTDDFHQEELPL